MVKSKIAASSPQNLNKFYLYGFGATILVLFLIFLAMTFFGSTEESDEDIPSLPDEEDEIPDLEEESALILDENPTPVEEKEFAAPEEVSTTPEFVGAWRVYSERLFYDEGGGGSTLSASSGTAVTQKLELGKDGSWTYGSSSGKWSASVASESDWNSWDITSYGPTRKIVLDGWNKGTASGPVEEESGTVNFIWVLYRVGPPTVSRPGTVHMKFGQ